MKKPKPILQPPDTETARAALVNLFMWHLDCQIGKTEDQHVVKARRIFQEIHEFDHLEELVHHD